MQSEGPAKKSQFNFEKLGFVEKQKFVPVIMLFYLSIGIRRALTNRKIE